jgi:hypothetical protein
MRWVIGAGIGLVSACTVLTPLDDLTRGGDPGDGGSDGMSMSDAGPIQFVQVRTTHGGSASTNWDPMVPLQFPVKAHDALIVAVVAFQTNTPVAMVTATDDRGDTFAASTTILSYDGWPNLVILAAFDVAGGTTTVTVHVTSPMARGGDAIVAEYSGIRALETFAGQGGNKAGIETVRSGSLTTMAASSLLVGLVYTDGTATPGTGFMTRDTSSQNETLIEDQIVTPGMHEGTATMSDAGNYWVMQTASFR